MSSEVLHSKLENDSPNSTQVNDVMSGCNCSEENATRLLKVSFLVVLMFMFAGAH